MEVLSSSPFVIGYQSPACGLPMTELTSCPEPQDEPISQDGRATRAHQPSWKVSFGEGRWEGPEECWESTQCRVPASAEYGWKNCLAILTAPPNNADLCPECEVRGVETNRQPLFNTKPASAQSSHGPRAPGAIPFTDGGGPAAGTHRPRPSLCCCSCVKPGHPRGPSGPRGPPFTRDPIHFTHVTGC